MFSNKPADQSFSLTIRPCQDEELQLVAQLSVQWEEEQITIGQIADDIAYLRTKLGPFFLLALWGEEIIGFVNASLHEANPGEMAIFPTGGRYLEIDGLYLLPAYREKEIGTALMNAVMQEARRQGIEHFSVYSSTKQWRRITAFYERLGFNMWFVRMFQ